MAESLDTTLISPTHSISGLESDSFELVELRIASISMLRSKIDWSNSQSLSFVLLLSVSET